MCTIRKVSKDEAYPMQSVYSKAEQLAVKLLDTVGAREIDKKSTSDKVRASKRANKKNRQWQSLQGLEKSADYSRCRDQRQR